jgi:hypothetical protein
MTTLALPETENAAPASPPSADDLEWARGCAECLRGLDAMVSPADADDLADEMRTHRRWRELAPCEAARRLFDYSFA